MPSTALHNIEQELDRRATLFRHLDEIIKAKFNVVPGDIWKRLRRSQVHNAIFGGRTEAIGGNWRMQRLIKEKLTSMGVGQVTNGGRRWFTGIELKNEESRR